jgi:hypothetical protein
MVANLQKGILKAYGRDIKISCIVRNDINGWRKSHEVVLSIPEGLPVYPMPFPKGVWDVGKPLSRTDPYLAPYFIPTNAYQYLATWTLDDGCYSEKTGHMTRDMGYGLHYSTSNTTQGCIKIMKKGDLLWLVEKILEDKEPVTLTVV